MMMAVGLPLAACDGLPGFNDRTPPEAAAPGQAGASEPASVVARKLDAIKAALQARNLGVARDLSRQAQGEFPTDPEVHLARSRIEAEIGNAGDSAAAFLLALDNGLVDPAKALADPVFDPVRDGPAFEPVHRAMADGEQLSTGRKSAAPPRVTSRLKAGDVEIVETESGASIRAGDVHLDADD